MRIVTTIQEGHPAQSIQDEFKRGLLGIAKDVFGAELPTPTFAWKVIPRGFAWTGGVPSNSSIVLFEAPKGALLQRAGSP